MLLSLAIFLSLSLGSLVVSDGKLMGPVGQWVAVTLYAALGAGTAALALGLVLLEHMQDKTHANVLKDEYVRCLLAGSIAGELCPSLRDAEEAFIGSMFQNLGRLLAEFYFPEEATTIRAQTTARQHPVTEAVASASVLGLSYEELGAGVAKAWGLPVAIQR